MQASRVLKRAIQNAKVIPTKLCSLKEYLLNFRNVKNTSKKIKENLQSIQSIYAVITQIHVPKH